MRDKAAPAGLRRILLIEDEDNIREAIRFLLTRDGWDVTVHADGATAAERVAALRPDVVLLDVMLPNRSGFDVLRDLSAQAGAPPVLMLTARGRGADRDLALSLGAAAFMSKPFSNAALIEQVRALGPSDAGTGA